MTESFYSAAEAVLMKKRTKTLLFLIVVALSLSGCRKAVPVKGVDLTVAFSEKTLTDNLMTEVRYVWKTASDFQPLGRDYSVYVHFWHNNNMILQDDFMPDVPTSKWERGKEYVFTRKVFIPPFIDEFDPQFKGEELLRLSVGLYAPYDRTGKASFRILEKKLKVLPPPTDTPEIVYEEGWYDQESVPDSVLKKWRWTSKEAKCLIDNPHRDAQLIVRGGLNFDLLKGQKVIFKINDMVLDEFVPDQPYFDKTYAIKADMLGPKDEFTLVIATDRTFVPAKINPKTQDQRELGMQISFLYFR